MKTNGDNWGGRCFSLTSACLLHVTTNKTRSWR